MKYSLLKGVIKSLKYTVLFSLPFLVDGFLISFPQLAQLTVGGLLVLLLNYLKITTKK